MLPALDTAPLAALLGRHFPGARATFEPMPGGASTRRYVRATLTGGTGPCPASAVAMFVPDATKADEIEKGGPRARWPFLEVRDLLATRGVDVPAILAEDTGRGWLVLEDLADATLAAVLAGAYPDRRADREALYTRAVVDLAHAQKRLATLPEGSVVASRTFDEDLLLWELDHFREWALEARGKPLSREATEAFGVLARRLAQRIASWPRTFTHRDYQSRNLMVRPGGALVWIDFQDALLGPRVYDLVALLNDSYQEFTPDFVARKLDDYAAAAGLGAEERALLGREFDLVTVQRKLKDAGRFVFIDRVKQNPSFLRFVEPTLAKARGALARLASHEPDMAELSRLVEHALA